MENAKFSLTKFGIEISGSEEFVERQVEKFKATIDSFFEILKNPSIVESTKEIGSTSVRKELLPFHPPKSNSLSAASDELDFIEVRPNDFVDYSNVFVIDNGQVQIIADINDPTLAQRMVNVILIYMYAKLTQGIDMVTTTELREACEFYGALDSSNFAKRLVMNKKYFLLSGDNRTKTVKLIRPGIKEAERIIKEIN